MSIIGMSLSSSVYGTDTSGRAVVLISYGWSSLTQSEMYSMPSSARMSSVSHVSVSPGPSHPLGFLPVKSEISRMAVRIASR
jgi:hypothetical protein